MNRVTSLLQKPVKVAFLTSDARETWRKYEWSQPYFGTAPEALLQGFAENDQLEVHVVSCLQKRTSSPTNLASNIWYHDLVVPKLGWLRTGYQGCIRAVRRKLRELQPDLVHAQGTERECGICGIFSGYPNLLTVHGNYRLITKVLGAKPFSYDWLTARIESFVLPRTDGVVCITNYTHNAVAPVARKTWVVPNAVHDSFFAIERKPADPPLLLCVGEICVRKNQLQLLKALEPLAARFKFVVKFFGGVPSDSPYGAEFLRFIANKPWAKYMGFSDREQLRQELSQAALLVLPTLEDNCPMVVLEAMASGAPVVASRVGGIPDLIDHGKTGYLCDPGDVDDIRSHIADVLEQPQLSSAIARRAKEVASQRFHPREIAARHLEIYHEVLNSFANPKAFACR
jgi:glycosyltransferase involved in cell wall biosynthesis